jgi:methionyl aminopeptidase
MTSLIKSPEEIAKIKVACKLAADVLIMITPYIKVGVTTEELNTICHNYMVNVQHTIPATLNYRGYPKSICTSINHVVCHGIPCDKKLKDGDILNIDVTVIKDGYFGDTSMMFLVGSTSILAQRLVKIAQECLYLGIQAVKPHGHIGDIGAAIQQHAEANHFAIVREYCGHGIGDKFHEDPQILHFGEIGTGTIMRPGMVFTIEPMLNAGTWQTKLLPDGWTVITKDRKLSAQWEHTIVVTENGCEVLTKRPDETMES